MTLLNRYTNQVLQNEDLDKYELFNRLKELNIINDTINKDKIKHHLKARDKPSDEIIIDYAFDGDEDDDDKYGLQTRLTKEQRLFRHRHKMKRIAKFISDKI